MTVFSFRQHLCHETVDVAADDFQKISSLPEVVCVACVVNLIQLTSFDTLLTDTVRDIIQVITRIRIRVNCLIIKVSWHLVTRRIKHN